MLAILQPTKMTIKVDLQCHRCYKKIKKILCGIPQVQDQNYDQAKNTVTITLAGGSPECVRQKILSKGRCFVQGVDILPEEKEQGEGDKGEKGGEGSKGGKGGEGGEGGKKGEGGQGETGKEGTRPVPGYPPVYVMADVNICLSCRSRGCGQFCPCKCHYGRLPMCHDGCGRPAHECGCRRPSYPGCCDRCNAGSACSSRTPHGYGHGWPPVCSDPCYSQRDKSCLQM